VAPEAVSEAAELPARMKTPNMRAPPTKPSPRENLLLMATQDQEAGEVLQSTGFNVDLTHPRIVRMRDVDLANLKRLKHIVSQEGFPHR
jgi:hypothetical protein